ncbi:MAG TPA: META domain-containing protein [Nakamurella sp.]|nr:META domain-containing protein [Nakamurella sp.]
MTWKIGTRRVLLATAAVALVSALSACAGTSTPAAGSGSTASSGSATGSASGKTGAASSEATGSGAAGVASDLTGKTVVAKEVTGSYTIVPGSTISITFENGTLAASAGCNNMSGQYTVSGNVLNAPQLASTMMACEEALMKQDTWLAAFLASSPTWTYSGGTLTLTNGTDTIALTEAPTGAAALEDTGWKLVGLISQSGSTVSAVDPSVIAWLRFADGQVLVNASCNSGSGTSQITDTTITFGPIAMTRRACVGPTEDVEQAMNAVLQGTTSYTVKDDPSGALLTIMAADGKTGLQLTADPAVGAEAMTSMTASPTS